MEARIRTSPRDEALRERDRGIGLPGAMGMERTIVLGVLHRVLRVPHRY